MKAFLRIAFPNCANESSGAVGTVVLESIPRGTMDTKWVTFRLQEGPGRDARYRDLLELVSELDSEAWDESTSFFLIQTELTTAEVASYLAAAILQSKDVLLVGSVTTKGVVAVGDIQSEARLRERVGAGLKVL